MLKNLDFEALDIRIDPEIEYSLNETGCDDKPFFGVTVYIETWFNVDKKFGLNIDNSDTDEYINLYAQISMPKKEVTVYYIMQHGPNDHKLTIPEDRISENDKKLILQMTEEQHQRKYKQTLDEGWANFLFEQV